MDRLTLTTSQQAFLDDYRSTNNIEMDAVVAEDTNIVVDDQIEIDNNWAFIVIGPSVISEGAIDGYIPDWGDFALPLPPFDVLRLASDRAGPNGEEMPLADEIQMQARAAKAAPTVDPKVAAKAERKEEHAHRRDVKEVLREAVAKLPHDQQKHAREVMRAAGVLGKDAP